MYAQASIALYYFSMLNISRLLCDLFQQSHIVLVVLLAGCVFVDPNSWAEMIPLIWFRYSL